MALKLRPSASAPASTKNVRTTPSTAAAGDIGRITKPAAARSTLRWDGSFALPDPVTRSDRVASFEEAGPVHAPGKPGKRVWAKLYLTAASMLQELNVASPD